MQARWRKIRLPTQDPTRLARQTMTARDASAPLLPAAIDAGWRAEGGCLLAGEARIDALAQRMGTPLFVYSRAVIDARIGALRGALPPGIRVLYAVKANPLPALLEHIAGAVDGFDIASGGELARALAAGMAGARLSFAGPGKADDELVQAAAADALVVLESADEARRLARLGGGRRPRVALRINPPFELAPAAARMGGGPRKFGVDSEQAPQALAAIAALPLEFVGFHCYAGSQCLDANAIIATQRMTLDLMAELARLAPAPVRLLNFGGGFGIPQHAGESPLDLARIGSAMAALARDAATCLPQAALTLELGRYLVGEAGLYVCRVIERKVSRGRTFLVLDGGLHHHWHATGALEGRRHLHFPLALANRLDAAPTETVTVAGPLCAPHDIFAHDVPLARAEPGDLIAVFQSGAYGPSASPGGFLGRPGAVEMLV